MSAGKPMRQIRVRRTYLIQRIQEWVVDIPAAYDTDEWLANDLAGFDQYVSDNGDQVLEDYEHVDYDELDLKVITAVEGGIDRAAQWAEDDAHVDHDAAIDERVARGMAAERLEELRAFHHSWGEQDTDSLDVLDLWEQLGRLLEVAP